MNKNIEDVAWYTLPHLMKKVEGINEDGNIYIAREENIKQLITKAKQEMLEEVMPVIFEEYKKAVKDDDDSADGYSHSYAILKEYLTKLK